MKINTKSYFERLGIQYDLGKTPLKDIKDQDIIDAYADKLVELYVELQCDERYNKNKKSKEEIESIENFIKEKIYHQTEKMTTKARTIVLEEMLKQLGKDQKEKETINIYIGMYKTAYEELKTAAQRRIYIANILKQKAIYYELQGLIENNGGNIEEGLITKTIRQGNIAKDVMKQNNKTPEYDVAYEDEDITLCRKSTIVFKNGGQFKDDINEYFMLLKEKQGNMSTGYSFYGEIKLPEMQNKEYRIAVYKALAENILENKLYIGSIQSEYEDQKKYYIIKDAGQESAVEIYEKQKAEIRREKNKAESEKDKGEIIYV